MSALVARAVPAVGCVAVAAWFAAGLAPVRDQAAAGALVNGPRAPSPATVDHAERLLVRAADSTSSREPDVGRAELLLFAGRDQEATRAARDLVREEPANVEGWTVLAQAAAKSDPALAARARARFRALSPPVAPAR